jgi:hypothetical protein
MAITLAQVTHYPATNTLEASWSQPVLAADGVTIESYQYTTVTNYSQPQKAQFLSDLNTVGTAVDGTKYVTMAGW